MSDDYVRELIYDETGFPFVDPNNWCGEWIKSK